MLILTNKDLILLLRKSLTKTDLYRKTVQNTHKFYFFKSVYFIADHPWIQNAKKASNVPLGDIVRTRLKQFSIMNRFKKKALRVSL